MLTTSILSGLIAYFIIKLYIIRIKGQDENLKKGNLRMETLEGETTKLHMSGNGGPYLKSPNTKLCLNVLLFFLYFIASSIDSGLR